MRFYTIPRCPPEFLQGLGEGSGRHTNELPGPGALQTCLGDAVKPLEPATDCVPDAGQRTLSLLPDAVPWFPFRLPLSPDSCPVLSVPSHRRRL